ncbi:hypothetical protein WJX84_002381 [Apatococcus fuscideae]|uniref:Uncharacterized protein n=1 Tax=Apatococcus fuscideae TaxID=2026836 RepID=A0AAW1T5F8_9CHLO
MAVAAMSGWTGPDTPPQVGLDLTLQSRLESWADDSEAGALPLENGTGAGANPHCAALAVASELSSLYLLEQDRQHSARPQQQQPSWPARSQRSIPQQPGRTPRSPFGVAALQEHSVTERTLRVDPPVVDHDFACLPCSSPSQLSDKRTTWSGQPVASPTAPLASPSSSTYRSQHNSPPAPLSPLPSSRLPVRSPATPIRYQFPLHHAHTTLGAVPSPRSGSLTRCDSFSPATQPSKPSSFSGDVGQDYRLEGLQAQQHVPASPGQPGAVGWGGQAIPDSPGFRVPWFGRSRGKGMAANRGGRGNRGKGRGPPGSALGMGGRRGGRRTPGHPANAVHRSALDSQYGSYGLEDQGMSVEELVALIQNLNPKQRIPDAAFHALFHFDSRATALLLKDLSKAGMGARASELFEWLRGLELGHPLQALLDVYTYTAVISMCIYQQDVERALGLAREMRVRGIERNVHTYTALMNVCIKCGRCPLALETYHHMRQDGCSPNVVTFNTLIDVHGKMGQWEQAIKVLNLMKNEGLEPVLRTYNTLIIACNMCNQPREAMAVYKRMLDEGYTPNATTYNALISAHGKAGQLDQVMEVFQEMVWKGCERSVITYSSLISACEKAGQWRLALDLFQEMHNEGCSPNTVTYNSLITACAQGSQWEKAAEVFEQMRHRGCTPDVVSYTALISAYEKGGQWQRTLTAYDQMRLQNCKPDAIVYNAIIDALWETGVIWAQRKARGLFKVAQDEGHFRQQAWDAPALVRHEVNLHAMTAGVAMLSIFTWLLALKSRVEVGGVAGLQAGMAIVTDKGKSSKEQGNLVVKEAVAAMMHQWQAPFRPMAEGSFTGILEASTAAVAAWLTGPTFDAHLFSFFPSSNIGSQAGSPRDAAGVEQGRADAECSKEEGVETRCSNAFAAVQHFERTHCLILQNMGLPYLQRRADLVGQTVHLVDTLGFQDEVAHDAVLLMDRFMSSTMQVQQEVMDLMVAACVLVAISQSDNGGAANTTAADLESITGLSAALVAQMEWNLRQVLVHDTAAISTYRCLKLFLERLGCNFSDQGSVKNIAGSAFALVRGSLADTTFLNCRPSVVAAAVVYAERRSRGVIPFWPSMLAKLTGYQDMSTPELSVAIKGAQRLCCRLNTLQAPMVTAPMTSLPLTGIRY